MNKYDLIPYTRGRGLQIGGDEKMFPHFIYSSPQDMDIIGRGVLDFVVIADEKCYEAGLPAWAFVKAGGYLCLNSPMDDIGGCDWIVNEPGLSVYRKRADKQKNEQWKARKPSKTAAVIRYGGFGDMIQASSILPGLKEQGYHITFFCSVMGYDIIRTDPNIDEIVVQDKDQVPNLELGPFWDRLDEKFDRVVNLSESVEGALLAIPGRAPYRWNQAARHRLMDVNYLELTHLLAGVEFPPRPKFHTTREERQWAERERRRMGGRVIMWALSGSSAHKAWPHLDSLVARLMLTVPDVNVVFVGDELSQILEAGWENEPRVIGKCGEWSIRETLAFAETVDLVIGPETGVLNSVGCLDLPKIIMLSHSSPENLTKYWKNTISLTPENCICYPCHMMHYGFENCPRDDATGTALCQARIGVETAWEAIMEALQWRQAAA